MTRLFRSFATIAWLGPTTALLAAQGPALNVRPGLWEMTLQVELPGAMPAGIDTSKMTPEQRAQFDVLMRGRGAAKPTVQQTCVTKEDIERSQFEPETPGSQCTTKVTRSTATVREQTQTCTGTAAGTRETRIEVTSPTSMKMVSKATSGRGAGTTVTIAGKWLADACGNVK